MPASEPLSDANGRGTFASRPAAGIAGRRYHATDTGIIYRDNGTSWDTENVYGTGAAPIAASGSSGPIPGRDGDDAENPWPTAAPAAAATTGGGSALTVQEVDGSPIDAAVTGLVFPNDTVSIAGHVATVRQVPYAFIGAKAYNSAVQSISTATETVATLDSEEFDTDGFHSTSVNTGRMTVPAGMGGKYLVIGHGMWNNTSGGSRRYIALHKNGVPIYGTHDEEADGSGTFPAQTATAVVDLAAGDYVHMVCYQDQGGSINFGFAVGSYTGGVASLSIVKLDSGKVGSGIGAKAYHSTTETIATGSALPRAMDSEFYDTDGFHSTVTNNSRMTIPVGLGGKYLVIGAVTWDTNATGQRICVIFKNGATVGGHTSDMANASYAPRQTCSIVLDLVPGDYVETYVYQDSGGTRTTGGSLDVSNQLTIMRLDSGSSAATLRSYIGYNTVGASYEATSSDKIYAKLVTPSVNCLLESVQAYIKGDGTHASSFGAAVYSDNAGTPGVLIAAASWPTNAGTRQQNAFLSATPRWIGIPMGVELTGGTSYWIAWYGSDGGGGGSGAHNIAYDSGTDKTLATAYVNDASVGSFSAASRSFSIRGLISNTTTINQSQLPGYEYDYVQVTSNASITATTGATASTIVTGSAVTYDGSTTVLIQFVCGLGEPPSGQSMYAVLYDGSTQLGYIARATSPGSSARWPIGGAMRLTPSAGSHTYSIRGFVDSGTGNFYAGSGAAATQPPMFIRITKV